jgi:hypothetical protein
MMSMALGIGAEGASVRLRRSNASCAGLGSSDEADSGEQRNDETHGYPPMERRHRAEPVPRPLPPGIEGYLANFCQSDESG